MYIWIILLVLVFIVFIYLASWLLPKCFFKIKLFKKLPKGQGQKIVNEVFGTTMLYNADKSINKHIYQYLISNRDNKVILLCDIDPNIYYLNYTCVCYNKKGQVLKMINVSENILSRGLTQELILPNKTSEVALIINNVNEEKILTAMNMRAKFSSVLLYGIIIACLICGLIVFTKYALSQALAGVFQLSFFDTPLGGTFYGMMGIIFCAIVILIYLFHKVNYIKKGDR